MTDSSVSPAPQRVSPFALPEGYAAPPKPPAEVDAGVADAYRQTGFVLGEDSRLIHEGMTLQIDVLRDSYAGPYRTHRLAAIAMFWSRAFAYQRDAVGLALHGAYPSALPLIRSTTEAIAAQIGLLRDDDAAAFEAWLGSVGEPDEALKAVRTPIGFYRTGSVLAEDPALGPIYRIAGDLTNTHFGASLLQVAPESNRQKLAVAFGERLFHVGWAELTLGWTMALNVRQLRLAVDAAALGLVNLTNDRRDAIERLVERTSASLARGDRCTASEIEHEGGRKLLVSGFRRAPGAAARRIVL